MIIRRLRITRSIEWRVRSCELRVKVGEPLAWHVAVERKWFGAVDYDVFGGLREPLEARFEKSGIEFQRLQCVQGKPAVDEGDAAFVAKKLVHLQAWAF